MILKAKVANKNVVAVQTMHGNYPKFGQLRTLCCQVFFLENQHATLEFPMKDQVEGYPYFS